MPRGSRAVFQLHLNGTSHAFHTKIVLRGLTLLLSHQTADIYLPVQSEIVLVVFAIKTSTSVVLIPVLYTKTFVRGLKWACTHFSYAKMQGRSWYFSWTFLRVVQINFVKEKYKLPLRLRILLPRFYLIWPQSVSHVISARVCEYLGFNVSINTL